MKKFTLLLLLLPLLFITACGDDKDDELEYLDPAIVEGTWLWVDGSHLNYTIFENEECRSFTIEKYTGFRSNERFYTKYQVTKDKIYRTRSTDGKTYPLAYTLEGDSILYIHSNTKYIKVAPLE